MITLPRKFFRDAQKDALALATPEGVCWVNRDIWILAGSPLSPMPRKHVLLLSCYDDLHPLSPSADAVHEVLTNLASVVPAEDKEIFGMRAAIIRAAMRSFCDI